MRTGRPKGAKNKKPTVQRVTVPRPKTKERERISEGTSPFAVRITRDTNGWTLIGFFLTGNKQEQRAIDWTKDTPPGYPADLWPDLDAVFTSEQIAEKAARALTSNQPPTFARPVNSVEDDEEPPTEEDPPWQATRRQSKSRA